MRPHEPHVQMSLFRAGSASWHKSKDISHLIHQKRQHVTLANLHSASIVTQAFVDARTPKKVKRLKAFKGVPPADLITYFHSKLNQSYSNPRTILKTYNHYSAITDHPDPQWLIRCFSQLANAFGPNSFWSTRDKQTLQNTIKFKHLVADIVENAPDNIKPRFAPRIIYAMSTLEYRPFPLLNPILDIIHNNLNQYTPLALAHTAISLANLGVGALSPAYTLNNSKTSLPEHDVKHQNLIEKCIQLILNHPDSPSQLLPSDWSGLAYALVVFGKYDGGLVGPEAISICLRNAVQASEGEILQTGWNKYYIYQTLYCTDVEKPANERQIKRSVPLSIQQELHNTWLRDIVLPAQPQGSEILQKDVDESLSRLRVRDALINCSFGRLSDEHHCWFANFLIKSRDLAIECDSMHPLSLDVYRPNGHGQLKSRILHQLGYNVATVHRHQWERLNGEQKDMMVARILNVFPLLRKPEVVEKPRFEEDRNLPRNAKSVPQKWPIEVYVKY